jgi:hypothetical protein
MYTDVNMIPLLIFKVKNFCLFSNPGHGFSHVSGKEIGIFSESKTNFKSSFVVQAFLVRSFKNRIVKYLAARGLSTTIEIAEPNGSLDAENVCSLSDKFCGGASDLNVTPMPDNSNKSKTEKTPILLGYNYHICVIAGIGVSSPNLNIITTHRVLDEIVS